MGPFPQQPPATPSAGHSVHVQIDCMFSTAVALDQILHGASRLQQRRHSVTVCQTPGAAPCPAPCSAPTHRISVGDSESSDQDSGPLSPLSSLASQVYIVRNQTTFDFV